MKLEHEKGPEREYQKEKAGAWRKRYDDALDAVVHNEQATFEELLDVIWNEGILGRIAPVNSEEKNARIQLKKSVWEGSRDDVELYWRILYSAGYITEPAIMHHSVLPHGYAIDALSRARIAALMNAEQTKHFFPKENQKDPFVFLAGKIMDRAREEISTRGGEPHEKLIPWGSKGVWKGVSAEVERYTGDGLLWLKGKTTQDHLKIGELTDFKGAISPMDTNPSDWKKE